MESRTQGSRPRPRTQKKSEAKDSLSEERHFRGQGQECTTKIFQAISKKKKKKVFTKIFQAISTKQRFPKNFSSAPQNFNDSKNSAVLEPRQANFRGLEASRPRPRTSKCVLKDSTSDNYITFFQKIFIVIIYK